MGRTLRNSTWGALIVLVVVLAVAGCQTPSPAASVEPTAPPPSGQPPADSGEPATAAPREAEESVAYSATLDALAALDSFEYHYSWSWEGSKAGTFQTGTFEGSGEVQNRPSRAQHVAWTTTDAQGAGSSIEYIFIEETGEFWLREAAAGVWAPITGVDPSLYEGFTLTGFLAPLMFSDAEDLSFVATETVNGVETRHYSSRNFSFLFGLGCTVAEASDDVWESIDLGVPVRHVSRFSGSCEGESAEWSFELNITNINGSVQITQPV